MNLSGKDAYTLMLKGYPDVMNIREVSKILGIKKYSNGLGTAPFASQRICKRIWRTR